MANAPGTVDAGYRGEIKVALVNLDPERTAVSTSRRSDRAAGRSAGGASGLPRGRAPSRVGACGWWIRIDRPRGSGRHGTGRLEDETDEEVLMSLLRKKSPTPEEQAFQAAISEQFDRDDDVSDDDADVGDDRTRPSRHRR